MLGPRPGAVLAPAPESAHAFADPARGLETPLGAWCPCVLWARAWYGGTEEGLLHVWETGQGLRLLHSIHAHQDSVLALATGEPFETPEDLLVARMNGSRLSSASFSLTRSARPSSTFKAHGAGTRRPFMHDLAEGDFDGEGSGDAEGGGGGEPSPLHGTQSSEEENGMAAEEEEEEGDGNGSASEDSQVFASSSSDEDESTGAGEVDVICRLYTGSMDKKIGVWDIPRNAKQPPILVCYLAGHWGWVRTIATSEDLLFSGSGDFTIRCWSARDLVCLHTLKIREHWINACGGGWPAALCGLCRPQRLCAGHCGRREARTAAGV